MIFTCLISKNKRFRKKKSFKYLFCFINAILPIMNKSIFLILAVPSELDNLREVVKVNCKSVILMDLIS